MATPTQNIKAVIRADVENFKRGMFESRISADMLRRALISLSKDTKKLHVQDAVMISSLKKMSAQYRQAVNQVNNFKTISDALSASLAKRKTFDFNKQFRFDVANASARALAKTLAKTTTVSKGFLAVMSDLRGTFLMLGLGMLFFGMSLKRLMDSIIKGSVSVFNRVMQESDNFGMATQRLAVHWEYLKFVLGSAINRFLEPLMPLIVRIINITSNWIQEHSDLAAGITLVAGALGSLLLTAGIILTPLGSLLGSLDKIKKALPFITPLFEGLGAVFTSLGGTILAFAAIVLAIAYGIYLAWKENFGKIQDWVSLFIGGFKQMFKGVWEFIKGIFGIITSLIKGDWEGVKDNIILVFKGIKDFLVGAIKAIIGLLVTIGLGAFRVVLGIGKTIKDALKDAFEWLWNHLPAKWKEILTAIWDKAKEIFGWIYNKIIWVIDSLKKAWNWIKKVAKGKLGGGREYQVGGTIPGPLGAPQLVVAHGGERIINRQQSFSFGNINVSVNTTGGVDAKSLADQLLDEIKRHANVGGL